MLIYIYRQKIKNCSAGTRRVAEAIIIQWLRLTVCIVAPSRGKGLYFRKYRKSPPAGMPP